MDSKEFERLVEQVYEGNTLPFIENCFHVRTKDNRLILFEPSAIVRDFAAKQTGRDILLKPRQVFSSTYNVLDGLARDMCIPQYQAFSMAQDKETSERIFDTVDRALEYFTPEQFKPRIGHDRADYIDFPDIGSSYYIGTARGRYAGTGHTINYLHMSEESKYSEEIAVDLMNSVMEAVPIGGVIKRESTPHGVGDTFHTGYIEAQNGDSSFKAHFYPWFAHHEFFLTPDSVETLLRDRGTLEFTQEEHDLMKAHGLTENQIRWRRWKINERKDAFWQEYPESDVTCWLSSEFTVFHQQMDILRRMDGNTYDPMVEEGYLSIWKMPDPMQRYAIGADIAAGDPRGDYSCASVVSSTGEEVAVIHGHIPQREFTRLVCDLGARYGNAVVAIERNSIGELALDLVMNVLNYPNIYEQNGKPGWLTTGNNSGTGTKDQLISTYKEALMQGHYRTFNAETIRETMEFREDPKTHKTSAPRGRHDDRLMATMIALMASYTIPIMPLYTASGGQYSTYPRGL